MTTTEREPQRERERQENQRVNVCLLIDPWLREEERVKSFLCRSLLRGCESLHFIFHRSTYTYCGIAQTLIKGNAHRTLFASDSSRASGSEPTSLQILRGRIDHIMPDRLAQAAADLVEDKALFEAV